MAVTSVLAPLAEAGADPQLVMGCRYPGNQAKAAIEVFPVKGRKAAAAAAALQPAAISAVPIEASALADAGINPDFLVARTAGRKCTAVAGFRNAQDARRAAVLIGKAAGPQKK